MEKITHMTSFKYTIVRSKNRHRSAALHVKPNGEVVIQAPWYMPKFILDKFVKDHESWIDKRLKEQNKVKPILQKYFASEEELKAYIMDELGRSETLMSLKSAGITFKKVRTYWGSCAPSGRISFNLELIHTPKEVVRYVVIHELAHLKYRGHGVRFWDLVTKHYGETKSARQILKETSYATRLSTSQVE